MSSKDMDGERNFGFTNDNNVELKDLDLPRDDPPPYEETQPTKDKWSSGIEFLMSCIAMSVGLGNIWRFPFTAYENGGGAFLIPYLIVLVLVGRPLCLMEMALGQFSSKGTMKVYDISPAMKGIGAGQTFAVSCVTIYYSSIMALIFYYFIASFSAVLPWSVCDPAWTDGCYPSSGDVVQNASTSLRSSSELYFVRNVLHEFDNINDGIGIPSWKLSLCVLFCWIVIISVLLNGVKSSGKASYFLALFPYAIMLVLFVKALTLKGSADGILFFIKPDFSKIFTAKVWYAAVTQSFFSLNVCFGNIITYASHNEFKHKIYRDTALVTTLDTFTSLLAGFTVFGILGNLAHETGKDIASVVDGGTGLAFISYPEAISKFDTATQLFSVIFFLMLFVMGIGSNIAVVFTILTVISEKFIRIPYWSIAIGFSLFGFCVAHIYITPGGQYLVNLVDFQAGSFVVLILGIGEVITVSHIYGLKRFTDDIEFMLNFKPGLYWRICWSIVTPLVLIIILIYSLATMQVLTYKNVAYPTVAIVIGWILSALGVFQLPFFAGISFWKRRTMGFRDMIRDAFKPNSKWGPTDPQIKREWISFTEEKRKLQEGNAGNKSKFKKFVDRLLGY